MSNEKKSFIIVGGQRCGTTWLYQALDAHPEIYLAKPIKPEPKYFLNDIVSKKEYIELYFNQVEESILGEKSTSYYETPGVIDKLKVHLPDTKIIFIVRNPIDRALSNYYFSKQNNIETRTAHEVFIDNIAPPEKAFKTSVDPFNYIDRGFYSKFIQSYLDSFGAENVKVVCFESIVKNRNDYSQLLNFIGVCNQFNLPDDKYLAVNASKKDTNDIVAVRKKLLGIYSKEVEIMKQYINTDYWLDFNEVKK